MEVLTKQEFLESIIFTCILASITSLVVNLILDKESVHFWIWQKTRKDKELIQEILSKEPTYELPGKTAETYLEGIESWVRAAESSGKIYLQGIESWAESIAYAYGEREE